MEGIRASNGGTLIDIEVSPNAKRERIKGYNSWRKRIVVEMKEKPEKFKVNKELVAFFSKIFNISKNDVKIVNGEKNPLKTILLEGIEVERAEEIIRRYIGEN